MSLERNLVWQELGLAYRSSIAHQFARYGLGLTYESLPPAVVLQAKRCLLDALGCAIGAYDAPGRPICESVTQELGGPRESTVFGSGILTNVTNATLVNSFLVRFLECNDMGGGGHNSESIPAILAMSERENAKGRDVLTSLVVSYELGARLRDSETGSSLRRKGWTVDIRGGLNMPPALGRLMGMSEDQTANAIGICACRSLPLGITDADREENLMNKNLRFGFVAYDAIVSCMLAKKGFTGPVRVVEGDSGIRQVIFNGEMDLERLVDFSGWRILNTRFKILCACGSLHGHIYATLDIVKEHDLKPQDIEAVRIKTCHADWEHDTTPAKKYPRNAESADHSVFYGNAIAIKERSFGPESFSPDKFTDPIVLDLIERITVEPDPTMSEHCAAGVSEITTTDGRRFVKRVDVPHGFGNDPLTDRELEDKFRKLASEHMGEDQIRRIFDVVWDLEKIDDIRELTRLMVFQPPVKLGMEKSSGQHKKPQVTKVVRE
jgi:2-methylcitrate dehydratase